MAHEAGPGHGMHTKSSLTLHKAQKHQLFTYSAFLSLLFRVLPMTMLAEAVMQLFSEWRDAVRTERVLYDGGLVLSTKRRLKKWQCSAADHTMNEPQGVDREPASTQPQDC